MDSGLSRNSQGAWLVISRSMVLQRRAAVGGSLVCSERARAICRSMVGLQNRARFWVLGCRALVQLSSGEKKFVGRGEVVEPVRDHDLDAVWVERAVGLEGDDLEPGSVAEAPEQ